jgi:hypothetical protein
MPPISAERAHHRARIAGITRSILHGERPIDDPALTDAKRDLAAVRIAEWIEKQLAAAPPLTDQQRTRLAELLKPVRQPASTIRGDVTTTAAACCPSAPRLSPGCNQLLSRRADTNATPRRRPRQP